MKDIGLTEQAKFYENFKDPSPLTDETLEGLGFDTKGKLYVNSAILSANYNTNRDIISVSMQTSTGYIKYKTVGKVKMLIEALKGDEYGRRTCKHKGELK